MQRKSNRVAESVIIGLALGSIFVTGCAAFMEGFGAGLGGAAGGITKHVPEIADAGLNGGLITAIVTAGIALIGPESCNFQHARLFIFHGLLLLRIACALIRLT